MISEEIFNDRRRSQRQRRQIRLKNSQNLQSSWTKSCATKMAVSNGATSSSDSSGRLQSICSLWFPTTTTTTTNHHSLTMAVVMVSFVLLIGFGIGADARPFETEIYRTYDHRSAIHNLKELDKFYTQLARPRFGKRFDPTHSNSAKQTTSQDQDQDLKALMGSAVAAESQQQAPAEIAAELLGNNRWICYNKPVMTKLTENYLKEILLEKASNVNDSDERLRN